jgi:ribosomal protein S27E
LGFLTISDLPAYTHSSAHIEICEICSKTFRTKNAIDEHMKTHTRKLEDRIRCEICGHFLAGEFIKSR